MEELHKTFFSIVNSGVIPQLEYILSQIGREVNKVDENGRTALHLTAMNEHYEACLMLAKHKNTEITPDAKRETVLHILARKKMLEVNKKIMKTLIQALIKRGGDVNQENKAGNTPLHDAISHDNRIVTKVLLSNGAKPLIRNHNGETAVHCCFINFGEEIAEIMAQKFSSVIDKLRPRGTGKEQPLVSLLHWVVHLSVDKEQHEKALHTKDRMLLEAIFTNCIKQGRADMVAVLLREPININTTDFNGWSPLHHAAMQGQFKIAKQILQQPHVDILVDRDGNTALYYLMQRIPRPRETCLYWQVLSLFVQQGLDVNFPNEKGETPLHEAAFRSNLPALQYLVACSADLTLQTNAGETALHYAARCNSIEVLKLLLAHASDEQLNILGEDGTAEEVAIKCFNHEAKLEFKARRNQTPLTLLPRPIWLKTFEYLSADTLARVSQACTTFLNLSRDDGLWKALVAARCEGSLLRALHHMRCFDSPTATEFVKSVLIRENNLRAHYFDRSLLLKCTAYFEPEEIPLPTVSKYDTLRKSMSAIFNKILKKSAMDIPPKNNSEETPPHSQRMRPLASHPLKVLVMGPPSTVKSALTRRLSQQEAFFASVLSDWSIVILPVGDTSQEIKITEVDDKQFLNLHKECDGVVLYCDYSHASCLDTLSANLREVKQKCSKDVRVVVFGAAEASSARAALFEEITSLCQSAFEDGIALQAYFEEPARNAELALHLLMTSMRRVQKQAMKL